MSIISKLKRVSVRKLIDYILWKIKPIYVFLFGRPIFAVINKFMLELSVGALGLRNWGYEGEDKFVKYLCKQIDSDSAIVLDIGANLGKYSEYILSSSKSLRVISFEPHPKIFLKLMEKMSIFADRFTARDLAVGSEDGELELFVLASRDGGDDGVSASLNKELLYTYDRELVSYNVKAVSLDDELTEDEMRRVRFIKIDTDGNEKKVLQGARKLIEMAGDNLYGVQVEFSEYCIYVRVFVKDIIELLPGFAVYRLLPNGKLLPLTICHDWKYGNVWQVETFAFQNLVFLNKANKTKLY